MSRTFRYVPNQVINIAYVLLLVNFRMLMLNVVQKSKIPPNPLPPLTTEMPVSAVEKSQKYLKLFFYFKFFSFFIVFLVSRFIMQKCNN